MLLFLHEWLKVSIFILILVNLLSLLFFLHYMALLCTYFYFWSQYFKIWSFLQRIPTCSSFVVIFQTLFFFLNLDVRTRAYIRMHNKGSRAVSNHSLYVYPFARNIATLSGHELVIWQLIQQRAQYFLIVYTATRQKGRFTYW